MRTLLKLAAGAVAAGAAYAVLVRPRMLRWGATEDEARGPLAGDAIIPGGSRGSTMAATLDAPPSEVWPWLVQMGFDRAGWYSWDLLDRLGRSSARVINPAWQRLAVGQRLAAVPDGKFWFDVAALEPERFLALRSLRSRGRQLDSAGPHPSSFGDALWAFHLKELPGARTRLVVTTSFASRPRLPSALASFLFWEPAHFLMQTRQFSNLERRVERASAGTA